APRCYLALVVELHGRKKSFGSVVQGWGVLPASRAQTCCKWTAATTTARRALLSSRTRLSGGEYGGGVALAGSQHALRHTDREEQQARRQGSRAVRVRGGEAAAVAAQAAYSSAGCWA
ncbi:unnamed protein product, partial [Ectocarpus sp. 12 AP-2014]